MKGPQDCAFFGHMLEVLEDGQRHCECGEVSESVNETLKLAARRRNNDGDTLAETLALNGMTPEQYLVYKQM